MFEIYMYLSVFYCLCYIEDISTDMQEEQVSKQIHTDANEEEDTRMKDSRKDNWRDVYEDGDYRKNIHDLKLEVYTKQKEELIKRYFLASVTHQIWEHQYDYPNSRGVNITDNCVPARSLGWSGR